MPGVIDLNGEVILSSLLQKFLKQVVESLGIVKTSILRKQFALFIRNLIPPTPLTLAARLLCRRTEASLVCLVDTGSMEIPSATSWHIIVSEYPGGSWRGLNPQLQLLVPDESLGVLVVDLNRLL